MKGSWLEPEHQLPEGYDPPSGLLQPSGRKSCPGCGMATIPVIELQPRPIPTEGRVLFVATIPTDDYSQELVEAIHAFALEAAPDRATVAVLQVGDSLDMLTDDQLAHVGLQRLPAQ